MSDPRPIQKLLAQRAASGTPTSVVQIGANDGVTSDPLHRFLMQNDWSALLVEPIEYNFRKLLSVYKGRPLVKLQRAAITDHCGEVEMHRFDPEAIEAGKIPQWGHGACSLHLERTALGWQQYQDFRTTETVPALTLAELLRIHRIVEFDILQIDAEGHDYSILSQLDFAKFRPAIINLEIVNLPEAEAKECKDLLTRNGYDHAKYGYDLVAVYRNINTGT